jgi:hypothetical protein
MEPIALHELRQVDATVRPLVPPGSSEEQAAEHLQHFTAYLKLTPSVPDGLRASFERLRTTYAYGVLNYDFYTIAYDLARLLPEQALRERFMLEHPRGARFRDAAGSERTLTFDSYENLHQQLRSHNRRGGWKLQLGSGGEMRFDGMLTALTEWARQEYLLHGQRNRRVEKLLADMRNRVAHSYSYHLAMPGDAAQAIADVAEIINRLWGETSGGGPMYPSPRRREIILIGWTATSAYAMHPEASLPEHVDPATLTCVVVKADPEDDVLTFDSQYETTRSPIDLLWGPGTVADARLWLAANEPDGDEVELLDRRFLVRYHDGRVELPRRPEHAAGLAGEHHDGDWILIVADNPLDVFNHARQLLAGGQGCDPRGYCKQCSVRTEARGPLDEVLSDLGAPGTARAVPDVRISTVRAWARWNEIIEGTQSAPGHWTVPIF